jgi:tRNA threonylcarbamoyladenosine biosynthesis protein TsaB
MKSKTPMKVLAIDTATEACSVALSTQSDVVSRFEICPQQHSQRLLPMVDEVLKEAGVELSELDLLAFGRGPGSFTGVRIATGMIQGLALGTGLQVAGVSTLAAMAVQAAKLSGIPLVACATDARMGEVYFAVYRVTSDSLEEVVEEQVCPPEVAASSVQALMESNPKFIPAGTGWAAYESLAALLSSSDSIDVLYPDANAMLGIAQALEKQGKVTEAAAVEPVYLRDKVTWKKLPGRE